MAPPRQLNPIILVGGQELTEDQLQWLIELRIETEMRLPGRVTLRFRDPEGKLAKSAKFGIGKKVLVKMRFGSAPLIDASITGLGYEAAAGAEARDRFDGRRGSVNEFFVIAHDNGYQLTRNCTVKGSEQATAASITRSLASAAGLTLAGSPPSGATFPIFSQLHSDFDLLNAIADRLGVDWWVSPGNKLHVGKATTSGGPTLKLGVDLSSFSMKASDLAPSTVSVRGWNSDKKLDLKATAAVGESPLWPKNVDLLDGFHQSTLSPKQATVVSARVMPTSTDDATMLAKGIGDRMAAAATSARGECQGNPSVAIGSPVRIERAGPASGTYNVTKVEHIVRRASFVTRFWAGDRTPTSIVDSLASKPVPSLPARHTGLVIGTVTNLGSGENAGMIRVKFPSLDSTLVSAWGRFVAPSAGAKGRGLVMLPAVGDEVLVGFEEGDMHRPVILGGLYAGSEKSEAWPVENDKVTERKYTSPSGHIVTVQDGEGDPKNHFKVTIKGNKGDVILRMGADKAEVTTPDGVPMEFTAGQASIKMDGQGNITIKGVKVSIEADTEMSVKGTNVTAEAKAELGLKGQAKAELQGALVNVTGQGPVAVKGAIVQIN